MNKEHLRCANPQDKDFLFCLANDEECRNNSFSTGKVKYSEHERWFEERLKSSDCIIYIYINESRQAIGQVRLDIEDDDKARISYSIIKEFRGEGYGKKMIQSLEDAIMKNSEIQILKAEVKEDNIPSKKIFESLGYEQNIIAHHIEYIKKL